MAAKFYDHLDADIKAILLTQIRNLWTHHSTSLEGNSLTLGETDFILQEGLTIQGKPLKDHNEVYGHAKAIERIYGLLNTPNPITKQDLFQLHQTVLTERIMDIDQPVGQWKMQSNFTTYVDDNNKQAWREYPAPRHIDNLMVQWLENLNTYFTTALDRHAAAEAYADLHLSFVTIHPFFDGNGRMARLLANLPVLNAGLPPIVVLQEDRYRYKRCLSDYQNTVGNLEKPVIPANAGIQKTDFTGFPHSSKFRKRGFSRFPVVNLPDLNDLSRCPDNELKQQFADLCLGYWAQTIELLDNANAMQQKRLDANN